MANDVKINTHTDDWTSKGFGDTLSRDTAPNEFIAGVNFDAQLDEMLFNRMLKLKNLPSARFPQAADPGKIFWDSDNKKFKLYVDSTSKFVDLQWTSTSTSTTTT